MDEEKFLNLIKKELVIALGCTEPIAIALATSIARKFVRGNKVMKVNVNASRNVIKNAMSVGIPGTKNCGINMAAALGLFAKDIDKTLELLTDITSSDVENAVKLVNMNLVEVNLVETPKKLFIEVLVETEISNSRVIIEDSHDNVVLVEVDGKPLKNTRWNNECSKEESVEFDWDYLNLDSIIEFIQNVDIDKLDLIKQSIDINKTICLEGLKGFYGLNIGRSIKNNMGNGFLVDDIANYATALTSAGSDARMAGCNLPVISNSGSGNQGILSTIPIVAFSDGLDDEKLIRAVTLSNLVTIYIKLKLGRLSAMCGASVAATGACCGITYLLGGDKLQIKSSIQNIMGNLTGMICDGAKAGCALKVATCTSAAIQSAIVTMEGNTIGSSDGIIGSNSEDTIDNFCLIGNSGMIEADKIILEIMLKKNNCSTSN